MTGSSHTPIDVHVGPAAARRVRPQELMVVRMEWVVVMLSTVPYVSPTPGRC